MLGPRGLTCQRNAILEQVRDFDVVVFFDDDFLPTPSYLQVVERVFATQDDVVMVTGLVIADGIIGPGLSLEDARSWLAVFGAIKRDWHELEKVTNGYGCNMALRVSAVEAGQCRFDEKLPLYGWLEDVDFSLRLGQRGRIVKAMAAQGVHLGIKKGRVLGGIDLDVGTAQANQFVHFAAREIHDISKIGISGRVGRLRLLRVIVGSCLLGANHSHFSSMRFTGA